MSLSPSDRFRLRDESSSSSESDNDDDLPPISGFSQPWNAPRRLVIEEPNSSDDESGYTTAREEDVDVPFENLVLSSSPPASAATSPSVSNDNDDDAGNDLIMASPSTLSVAEKLLAGGIPHLVNTVRRDSTGVSSLEVPTDDESHVTTPPKGEPSLDDISEALADTDEEEEEDDTSTVVQEGRTKTPKRKPMVDDKVVKSALLVVVDCNSMTEQNDAITVWNKENECDSPPARETYIPDYNSEVLVDRTPDNTTTVLHDKTPKRETSLCEESEPLVDSSPDDTATVLYVTTPKCESSLCEESKALVDSSPEDTSTVLNVETSKREPSFCEESEALVDSSPDDTSTVLYIATPKYEYSLCEESEALVDSSPDDTTTVLFITPKRGEHSPTNNSEALVDSSPDDATTVLQVETPERKPSLSEESEALVDTSPDDTSTVLQEDRPRAPDPKLLTSNNTSECHVGSSPDDTSTVLNASTPKLSEEFLNEDMMDEDDSTSTVYPAETPWKGGQPSSGNGSDVLLDNNLEKDAVSAFCPIEIPRDRHSMRMSSEALVDSSLDDSDSSTVYPADTPDRDSSLGSISSALADIHLEKDSVTASQEGGNIISRRFEDGLEEEEKVSVSQQNDRESPPIAYKPSEDDGSAELFDSHHNSLVSSPKHKDSVNDSSSESISRSPPIRDDGSTVVQEDRAKREVVIGSSSKPSTVHSPILVDTSSERDDSSPVGPLRRSRETLLGVREDELVDTSTEEDDSLTIVQEGRARTPKCRSVRDDDSDHLSDSSIEQDKSRLGKTGFKKDYDGCAWDLDEESREVFLSDEKFCLPDVSWPRLRLPLDIYESLYLHQKEGVQWMAGLHGKSIGGILGDDMGMGKTYQSLSFLGGLMRARTIRNALVVAPLSVLQSWEKEARVVIKRSCVKSITIIVLSSDMAKNRRQKLLQEALSCSAKSPYLVITTYGLVQSSPQDFTSSGDRGHWGYVVLDEGHKIKNPSAQVSKACEQICSNPRTRRLVLTGTLIQNNLKELWAVVNWATSGNLFGTLPKFKNQFALPIEEGRHKNASDAAIRNAELANINLQERLRPHYLQRLKSDFMREELPEKNELVVWTHLSPKQRNVYHSYINDEKVKDVVRGDTKSPLEAITWLKKLCGHPLLVEIPSSQQYCRAIHVDSRKREDLLAESAKLVVLVALLEQLGKSGHRTLIFSQSTRMLDIIEHVLCRIRLSRIDGSTKGKDRQSIVDAFNSETSNVDVMLLSTKAAGLGLTLTGADCVCVFDPSWNPAEDSQAIDRAYRIGQRKDVTVYRFVAAGTVEEKMYEKQVHKDGIRRAVTTSAGNATERFFEKKDLRKLFELAPAGTCEVLDKIQANHSDSVGCTGKSAFLKSHPGVVGVSSHDDIYLCTGRKDPNGDEEVGTPFGGNVVSATKSPIYGKSQKVLAKARQIDFNIAVGSSSKENRAANVASTKAGGSTLESAINVDMDEDHGDLPTEAEIESLLNTVDKLREQGNEFSAFSILIELLKAKEAVKGKQKLRMHTGLAELGRSFGWLYNDSTST